jgi:glycosyltransferase involved in cell wall biosynthesis
MITVIVPAYNEEKGIEKVINRLKKVLPKAEIMVIDDGSEDNTYEKARKTGVKIIRHSSNMGKAYALKTGYKNASGEIIANIDADCTYPPEEIPKMIEKLNGFDMVVGSRFKRGLPHFLPLQRSLANMAGSFFLSILLFKRITDASSGLRVFKKELTKLNIKATGLEYEVEFTTKVIINGYKYTEIPIDVDKRLGRSKLNFFGASFKFLYVMLKARFSNI